MARSSLAAAIACCTLLAFSGTAHAAAHSVFSDEATFIAAAAAAPTVALTLEDFNTTPVTGAPLLPGDVGLPIVTPTGVAIDILGAGGALNPSIQVQAGSLSTTTAILWTNPSTGPGTFSQVTFDFSTAFPGGINAFGIQVWNAPGTLGMGDAILTLTTADGVIITQTFPPFPAGGSDPSMGFLGVIDKTASFVMVTIEGAFGTTVPDSLVLDDLRFGAVSTGPGPGPVIPEPTSMALFGLTALGLAFGARRRKQKAQLVEDTTKA